MCSTYDVIKKKLKVLFQNDNPFIKACCTFVNHRDVVKCIGGLRIWEIRNSILEVRPECHAEG